MSQPASRFSDKFLLAWARFVDRRALALVLLAAATTTLLGLYGVRNLSVDADTDAMIDPSLPFRQEQAALERAFPMLADNFVLVVRARYAEQAARAATRLRERLARQTDLLRSVQPLDGDPFLQRHALLYQDIEPLAALSDRLAAAQPLLAALADDPSLRGLFDILGQAVEQGGGGPDSAALLARWLAQIDSVLRARLAGDPARLSWRAALAEQPLDAAARRRLLLAEPRLDFGRLRPAQAALEATRSVARALEAEFDGQVRVQVTGGAALGADELTSAATGATLAGLASLVLVLVVLTLGLRSARLVAAALITLLAGLLWTLAFAVAAFGTLNLISVSFAVLFIGLGIDFAIHYCLRYREARRQTGDHRGALIQTTCRIGRALALCTLTTTLAFLAFTPTAYAGLAQLGVIAGVGMLIALGASLTLLPALLRLFPARVRPGAAPPAHPRASRWIAAHARAIGWGALLAAVLALPFALRMQFDFDPLRLKDPEMPSVGAFLELLEEPGASPYTIEVMVDDAATAARLAERLRRAPLVERVVGIESFVPDDQDAKLEILESTALFLTPVLGATPQVEAVDRATARAATADLRRTLAASAQAGAGDDPLAAAAQRLAASLDDLLAAERAGAIAFPAIEDALLGYWPRLLEDLQAWLSAEPVTLEALPDSLRRRYLSDGGLRRLEVVPRENLADAAALRRFVEAVSAIAPAASGNPVQIVRSGEIVAEAMLQATATAALLIVAVLWLVLRRLRSVALVLLPVALAALLTLAGADLLGIPFNFANVIVLPLLLGLGVDSGIHLVLRAERGGLSGDALFATSTPRAVLLSALTTVGSFGSLAFSPHRGTASMGELLTLAVAFSLLTTLVVLPAVLTRLGIKRP